MQVLTTAVAVEEAPCMQVLTTAVVVEEALALPASVEGAAAADVTASVEEAADVPAIAADEPAIAADEPAIAADEPAIAADVPTASQEPAACVPTAVAAETKTLAAPCMQVLTTAPSAVAAETKTLAAPPAGRTVRKFKRPTR